MSLGRRTPVLTVIFGAGASYGSSPVDADGNEVYTGSFEKLPLTSGLFGSGKIQKELKEKYSTEISGLVARVQAARDLEVKLESLVEDARERPHAKRLERELAVLRFYLRDLLKQAGDNWLKACGYITMYCGLLQQIEEWREYRDATVNLVTFNYDILLEDAAERALHIKWRESDMPMDAYITDQAYRLFKLHGSVDWEYEAEIRGQIEDVQSFAMDHANEIAAKDVVKRATADVPMGFVGSADYGPLDPLTNVRLPAISVPTLGKAGFACPPSHVIDLQPRLAHSDCILTIGWRARDDQFWKLWRDSLTSQEQWPHPAPLVGSIGVEAGSQETLELSWRFAKEYWSAATHPIKRLAQFDPEPHQYDGGFAEAVSEGVISDWLEESIDRNGNRLVQAAL